VDLRARARDWSEIQERMLVPLYEAVYERLEVGSGTRLLALGCGSGLALLLAASRGAAVTGVDSRPERLALARQRLLPQAWDTRPRTGARLAGTPADALAVTEPGSPAPAYTLVTAFEPIGCLAGDPDGLAGLLATATPLAEPGAQVVLAGWGPPEQCTAASVLRTAAGPAAALCGDGGLCPARRDDLEDVARRAGLRPDTSGRVACPFGYADLDSAVRGMLATGLFDAAIAAADRDRVEKELAEALHAHQRRDGTVWLSNVFRYLITRT
jgi:SAM-dependent methyltransferase